MSDLGRMASIIEMVAMANGGTRLRLTSEQKRLLKRETFNTGISETITMTPKIRELLRRARFVLDPADATAPVLDPVKPFGTLCPLGDMNDFIYEGTHTGTQLCQEYKTVLAALVVLMRHGHLKEGNYPIYNLSMRELCWYAAGHTAPMKTKMADFSLNADGLFHFTPKFEAMVNAGHWRDYDWRPEFYDDSCLWPIVGIDAKQPYVVDRLADKLGGSLEKRETMMFWDEVSPEHKVLLPACQVFIEHAEIEYREYRVNG